MVWAALLLALGSVFPFLCATIAMEGGMQAQMEPHAHLEVSGMPLQAEPSSEHGCVEPAPPLLSREGGPGFIAGVPGWRNLLLEVEPLLLAPLLVPNQAVAIRAMFQVYRL